MAQYQSRTKANDQFDALVHWIEQQNCVWLEVTFRVDGVRYSGSDAARIETALRWTVDRADQWHRRGRTLRSVLFHGGEPELGISAHIQGLIELPPKVTIDAYEKFLTKWWQCHLKERLGRDVRASVWLRARVPGEATDLRYYARKEGPTFSSGLEKVLIEQLRLVDAYVPFASNPRPVDGIF